MNMDDGLHQQAGSILSTLMNKKRLGLTFWHGLYLASHLLLTSE